MQTTQILTQAEITNGLAGTWTGQPGITYSLDRAPFTQYRWNGTILVALTAADSDVGFANPMTTAGDTVVGGVAGAAARQAKVLTTVGDLMVGGVAGAQARLANPGAGTFALQSIEGVLTWVAVV
jgi:hypothetical protein